MPGDERRAAFSVASGIIAGLGTATGTWLSLSSIAIDDGLEGLIVLPILAAICAVPGSWLGYRQSRLRGPITCAVAATATVTASLLIWQEVRGRGGPPVLQNLGLGIVVLLPFAMLGVIIGFSAGWVTFSVFGPGRRDDRLPTNPAS